MRFLLSVVAAKKPWRRISRCRKTRAKKVVGKLHAFPTVIQAGPQLAFVYGALTTGGLAVEFTVATTNKEGW